MEQSLVGEREEYSASSLPRGQVWGMHLQSFDLALHLKAGSGWEGGQGKDTVRGALPDDLGFAVGSQVIWYFLQGSPGNQPAQGWAQMDWRGFVRVGGGVWVVEGRFAEASGYHEITPEKIQM